MTESTRISLAEAEAIIDAVAAASRQPVETVALARAHRRVLAEDLVAAAPLPGFDNAAMDGFALRHADLAMARPLRLVGDQFAGLDRALEVGEGDCLRITTGAPMPRGADTVVMKENARVEAGQVYVTVPPSPRANVRYAGEDVAAGETVLQAGQGLSPARLSLAAALGRHDLPVSRRPTVAVFTTGDELVPPGQPLAPGQIHDSNRVLLQALLQADGLEPVAWPVLPDDPARLSAALRDAAFGFDVVITCGGVSAGEKDHLPALLRDEGRVHFWKVRMKPGMPLLFGQLGQAQFLGLPGNPVSVLATYLALGRRLLDGLQGRYEPRPRLQARLASAWRKSHERLEFVRGRLEADGAGGLQVWPDAATGSNRLRAAAQADALLVLPEGAADLEAGERVEVMPFAGPWAGG